MFPLIMQPVSKEEDLNWRSAGIPRYPWIRLGGRTTKSQNWMQNCMGTCSLGRDMINSFHQKLKRYPKSPGLTNLCPETTVCEGKSSSAWFGNFITNAHSQVPPPHTPPPPTKLLCWKLWARSPACMLGRFLGHSVHIQGQEPLNN